MSEYDIQPATDNPPTFTFDEESASDEEKEYVLAYVILLQQFYDKYKFKSVDYVIENVIADTQNLEKDFLANNENLTTFYDNAEKEYLKENGVVVGKLKKAKKRVKNFFKKEDPFDSLTSEQKTTISSITLLLGLGILSTAHYTKARRTTNLFSIDSDVRNALTRTQNMASSGYLSTKGLAQNGVLKLLYGDPLMDWITEDDKEVCSNCDKIQSDNPHKLSEIPLNNLHPHCRCHRRLHNKENSYTGKALDLIFY